MSTSPVLQHLVLRKAASVCGGEEALSRILNRSPGELRRWMEGKATVPLPVLNKVMKLVNEVYASNCFRRNEP